MGKPEFLYNKIELVSDDGRFRWKLFVRHDGRLCAVQLFDDGKGTWNPKGSEKVLAWTMPDGTVAA